MYTFECKKCGARRDEPLHLEERDTTGVFCRVCKSKGSHARGPRMVRVPTSAAFTIDGFNAKNGYSK